jgi:hypothetical protein
MHVADSLDDLSDEVTGLLLREALLGLSLELLVELTLTGILEDQNDLHFQMNKPSFAPESSHRV